MLDEGLIKSRVDRVRGLAHEAAATAEYYEAAAISQSIVHDTIGSGHPLMRSLEDGVKSGEWTKVLGACKAVIALYDDGLLKSPALRIAHEMEGGMLDIADAQVKMADSASDPVVKQLGLAIAAFLAGAVLEDSLRRLCDASGVAYDVQSSKISKLQEALYQPSKQIEVISQSENKQIVAWGDTRNKADHGKFAELTQTEVVIMTMGVRSFIDKHLP